MRWLALSLAGPSIWAVGFTLVYALHGAGCARGWTEVAMPVGADLHHAALWAGWLATLAAGAVLLVWLRAGGKAEKGMDARRLPQIGAWMGLGATLVTLSPVALASSC